MLFYIYKSHGSLSVPMKQFEGPQEKIIIRSELFGLKKINKKCLIRVRFPLDTNQLQNVWLLKLTRLK